MENKEQASPGILLNMIYRIAKICSVIALVMVALLAIVVLVDVILRNLDMGVPGLSEAGLYLMVALTFLTLPYVGMMKGHLRVPILFDKFTAKLKKTISVSNDLLVLIILGFLLWQTSLNAVSLQATGTTSLILKMPVFPIAWTIPFGLGISAIILVTNLIGSVSDFLKERWWHGAAIAILIPLVFCSSPIWLGWLGVTKEIAGLLSIAIMLVLLFLGLPIAYALIYAGLGTMGYLTSWPAMLSMASTIPYQSVANYFLICVPLFLLMGSLCVFSGISRDLFATAQAWLGRVPGSLALATIAGAAMFGAICGDSIATAVAMGKVSLEPMKRARYDRGLAGACVAVGGTLGILIPPSIPLVVYAVLTETSVSALFMAGIIPGILDALAVMVAIYFWVKANPKLAPMGETVSTGEKLRSLKGTIPMILLFLLVIGGMYAGWFTPIEASAVGTFGALLFAAARKSLTWKNLNDSLLDAAQMCGMVLVIFIGINFLTSAMSLSQIPFTIASFAEGLNVNRWIFFAGLILLYLIAGMFMNIFAAIMITIPILLPLIISMQFDLVWLGIIMILLVMIGQVTPPVAIVVYAVTAMNPEMKMEEIFKRVTLLWVVEAAVIALIVLIPPIALFLPSLMH